MRLRSPLLAVLLVVAVALAGCGTSAGSDGVGSGGPAEDPSTTAPPTTGTGGPTPIVRQVDGSVQDGVEVAGDGYHGWLIDPDAHEGWMFPDGVEPFFPTEEEAATAEAVLAEQLPVEHDRATEWQREQLGEVLADLGSYERQYAGGVVEGANLLYVNALCTTDVGGGDLSTDLIGVDDGGSCFWNATVDLDEGTLVHVSVNGQA